MSKPFRKNQTGNRTKSKKVMDSKVARDSERTPNVITQGPNNDPSWYTHIYTSSDEVAKIPFNYPSGITFDPMTHKDNGIGDTCESTPSANSFPGICVFQTMPTLGKCDDPTDGANIAMQQLYSIVRKANAGAKNYDAADLMLVVLAMNSAYMLYNELCRAYRVYSSYDPMNRYQPNAILRALGFSPDLEKDRANLKALLDLYAYKLSAINIPDQFDYIRRQTWLYSNVYTDAANAKAQFYAYVPDGYYVWTEGTEGKPTYLKYVSRYNLFRLSGADDVVSRMSQIQFAMDYILNPIFGSQDVGLISGDLSKAFDASSMIKIQPVEELEAWSPAYSEEVLLQMMNATICSATPLNGDGKTPDITIDYSNTANGPILKQTVVLQSNSHTKTLPFTKRLINMIHSEPTADNVLVATRLMVVGKNQNFGGPLTNNGFTVLTSGTEIVTHAYVYYNRATAPNTLNLSRLEVFQTHTFDVHKPGDNNEALVNFYETALLMSKFDYAPAILLFTPGDDSHPAMSFNGVMQDVCDYTWIDDETLTKLNDVCIMSLFYTRDYSTTLTR